MTILAIAATATAQLNLVPNPGFEDTVNCSVSTASINKATHWYNPNNATPDVWDCDLDRLCGMAMSPAGGNQLFQYAYEGSRHAGIYCWYGPGSSNTREYLGVRLIEPMLAGSAYEVSLWVVRRRMRYAVDHIGVWFGPDSLWQNTTWWLSVTPQVRLRDPAAPYLLEGHEWTRLVDTLVAEGGEQWMVIGNFDVADSVDGIFAQSSLSPYAYYFIDQVEVREIGPIKGVGQVDLQAWWGIDGLNVRLPDAHPFDRIVVSDALGRIVLEHGLRSGGPVVRINGPLDAEGLYIVQAIGPRARAVVKVVKGKE
ncbi:MAG: hypothetical protein KF905_12140 [Flavobacteriales bacterium]|nr:hypothetical protein [Flavobacteriales bacterium]